MIYTLKQLLLRAYALVLPTAAKHREELAYWKGRLQKEGTLSNRHYEPLYTEVYGLKAQDFAGKRIIDIGCGPRGSLEWASDALERIGLDPLVNEYLKLGADKHAMKYVAASSENIPFPDGHFDYVTCLNALDHVADFEGTVREIKRVLKRGGQFLLSVEIDHPPTMTEPVSLSADDMTVFKPEFETVFLRKVGTPDDHDLHRAVRSGSPAYVEGKPGILVARLSRL